MAKTIEQLENDFWGEPTYSSHTVLTSHHLRKKPIDQFGVEDLRFMVGQNIGTHYIMPRALGLLEQTPLVTDYHYPGELLHVVLKLPAAYWNAYPDQTKRVCGVAKLALTKLAELCEQNKQRAYRLDGTILKEHRCLSAIEREIQGQAQAYLASYCQAHG